jgi:hypothetical protein
MVVVVVVVILAGQYDQGLNSSFTWCTALYSHGSAILGNFRGPKNIVGTTKCGSARTALHLL